jgi:hypothetical protein
MAAEGVGTDRQEGGYVVLLIRPCDISLRLKAGVVGGMGLTERQGRGVGVRQGQAIANKS